MHTAKRSCTVSRGSNKERAGVSKIMKPILCTVALDFCRFSFKQLHENYSSLAALYLRVGKVWGEPYAVLWGRAMAYEYGRLVCRFFI